MLLIAVILSVGHSEAYWLGTKDADTNLAYSYVFPSKNFYLKEVLASEVLERIESGKPVVYDNVIIKGDLSLNRTGMPKRYINWYTASFYEYKTINGTTSGVNETNISGNFTVIDSLIKINNSLIEGKIDFSNLIFQAPNIGFNNTKFIGNSSFANSSFNGSAYFVNTIFNGSASFRDSEFNKPVFFMFTTFNKSADFIGTGFLGFTSFWSSRFNQAADFRGANFYETARIFWSEFLGEANFKWAQFHKEASFWNPKFKGNFETPFLFYDHVDFRGSEFNKDVSFMGFQKTASFSSSEFKGNASFGYFYEDADFDYSKFNQSASFNRFYQNASFNESKFSGDVTFEGFNGTAYFNYASFNKDARFYSWDWWYTDHEIFKSDAFFEYSEFNGSAFFDFLRFNGTADFAGSKFKEYASFVETQFNKSVHFDYAAFNRGADFRGTRFNQSASFIESQFENDSDFSWSYMKSVDFNGSKFAGDLSLKGAQIDNLNLTDSEIGGIELRSWESIGHMEFDEMAYQLLMSNFRNRNLPDDANECYYDYRNGRRATLGLLFQPVDYVLMLFYGYGVKPERPVIWALVFIAFFALLFWWRQGIMPVREGEPESEANHFTPLEAMAFSGMTFLSGGKLVFDPPEYRIAPGKPWRDVQICKALFVWERLMGMILIVMFAIAVSKTIILGS